MQTRIGVTGRTPMVDGRILGSKNQNRLRQGKYRNTEDPHQQVPEKNALHLPQARDPVGLWWCPRRRDA